MMRAATNRPVSSTIPTNVEGNRLKKRRWICTAPFSSTVIVLVKPGRRTNDAYVTTGHGLLSSTYVNLFCSYLRKKNICCLLRDWGFYVILEMEHHQKWYKHNPYLLCVTFYPSGTIRLDACCGGTNYLSAEALPVMPGGRTDDIRVNDKVT